MKFSIIICTYNASTSLPKTFDSVLSQSLNDYEVILVDGASTDGTQDVIRNYEDKFDGRLRCISEPDSGIYDAMNKGIDLAKGEWLYFMGSGDVFVDNETLQKVLLEMKKDSCDIIYGNVQMGNGGKIYDGEFTKEKLIQKNICHQAIFSRKNIFEKIGKYNTKYITLADWEHNMRWINNESIKYKYIDIVIARYASGGRSKTAFDKSFYADFEDNIKKYFPQEYWKIYKKTKKREIDFVKNEKNWKLWEWNNKIRFTVFHPLDFFRKYLKK